jgi:kinetochore protein Nuf2
VPFTAADLLKPNPQQIQMVLEWFAELLMNATREMIEPAMRAASQDICGDYSDVVPGDTRNLMGFFVSLRKLMIEVAAELAPGINCVACLTILYV